MSLQPTTDTQLRGLEPAERHRFAINQLRQLLYSGTLNDAYSVALIHAMGVMDAALADMSAQRLAAHRRSASFER